MRFALLPLAIIVVLAVTITHPLADRAEAGRGLRPAAVAGRFYPGDTDKLERAIDAYMADARPATAARPIAIVAPHAGYIYSGQIAADAYQQAAGHDYDLVIILGTNHTTAGFRGVSIYRGTGYLTPLGTAEIDTEVVEALLAADRDFMFRSDVHEREHSVEVQVPFVQRLFPGTRIVAAVVGQPDVDLCRRFGTALAEAVADRRALIVASTDLSHYPAYDAAVVADCRSLAAVASLDEQTFHGVTGEQLAERVAGLSTCACGEAPVMAAMVAAKALGARRGVVVSYANSGDAAVGSPDRVVGYGAVAFCAGEPGTDTAELDRVLEMTATANVTAAPATDAPISAEHRAALLALARETIQRYQETGVTPLARDFPPELCRKQGAFVTLEKHHRLRGCIGHMAEDRPLCQVVGAMALQAAFNDRRFDPLAAGELDDVEIEISVLTPHRPVTGPEEIVVGRDGVVLRKAGRSAVYLPHVATEQGWDRDTMLDHLARKAGLPADAWREGATFLTFQAEVFGESSAPEESERDEAR
jgi:AmmeMemoRadiSam system protein B/AmmeMemoRadiSam system protein A